VQLADDHALGAVDDERRYRHQRMSAEKYFLSLMSRNVFPPVSGPFVNRQRMVTLSGAA